MTKTSPIKRALLSVSDKTGLIEFARALHDFGVELISTGGTAASLHQQNIPVTEVADFTGYQEIMDGRVKTLHPKIHGGILARRDKDIGVMAENQILPIDLVVVNLYPFAQTIAKQHCSFDDAIENIDIGGPAMVRAAGKNQQDVTVIVDPNDYAKVLSEMSDTYGTTSLATRSQLAAKAFAHTAEYDSKVAKYLAEQLIDTVISTSMNDHTCFPDEVSLSITKKLDLRYGENGHQKAAFYLDKLSQQVSVSSAKQLQGKALSFNNIVDADTAVECVKQFDKPACVIVKHANPCGVAVADNLLEAYQRAFQTDPTSAFGGIIAVNQCIHTQVAEQIINNQFVEVIIAPDFTESALAVLSTKKNVRLLETGQWEAVQPSYELKQVTGGLLIQDRDTGSVTQTDLSVVTTRQPPAEDINDMLFCWKVAKFVKSNAIVYAKNGMTLGIGAGQMSRVYSAKIAVLKAQEAGLDLKGAVMASDAFLPFRDGVDAAAKAGIRCIIQPGGSIRDDEVIAAANEFDMAMIFTGMRHFRH